MTDVRKQYKKFYTELKQKQDEKSRNEFNEHREKVLLYRKHKRAIAIQNIQKHERMMQIEKEEHDRESKERAQRAINWEAIQQSKRRDNLMRLAAEADYFITPDNIDRHIDNQLNPARVVVPTVFGSGKYGINDEVALEHLKVSKDRLTARKESLGEDPLYPNARVYADQAPLLASRFGTETSELNEYYTYINDSTPKGSEGKLEEPTSLLEEEDEMDAIDIASLELEDFGNLEDDFTFREIPNIKELEKTFNTIVAQPVSEGFDSSMAEKLLQEMETIEEIPAEEEEEDISAYGSADEVSLLKDLDNEQMEAEEEESTGGRGQDDKSKEAPSKSIDEKLIKALDNSDFEYITDRAMTDKQVDPLISSVDNVFPIIKNEVDKERLILELGQTSPLAKAPLYYPIRKRERRRRTIDTEQQKK